MVMLWLQRSWAQCIPVVPMKLQLSPKTTSCNMQNMLVTTVSIRTFMLNYEDEDCEAGDACQSSVTVTRRSSDAGLKY